MNTLPTWRVILRNIRDGIPLPDGSVHCCVTSPPYWGLRDYGVEGQLGREATPAEFISNMVAVFREVRRVLRDDGTLWMNMGDSYWNGGSEKRDGGHTFVDGGKIKLSASKGTILQPKMAPVAGWKTKDLVGMPWRLAFALQADGWYLRSDIIWAKPNAMPESVTDRPTKSHEYMFLLSKKERYYYDAEAVKEPGASPTVDLDTYERMKADTSEAWYARNGERPKAGAKSDNNLLAGKCPPGGRNLRTVWTIPTQPYPDAHFATFPERLVEPCIKAGCPAGGTVLDPFTGSGTTGEVAVKLGRSFVGMELNPAYREMARKRIGGACPLLATEVV